jgi:hypothetical protein
MPEVVLGPRQLHHATGHDLSPAEIACRGNGSIKINEEALDCLQTLRDLLGKPMIVLSGYRSPEYNRRVGGARASKHMEGTAFDISIANHEPVSFEARRRGRQASSASASTRARGSCTSTSVRHEAGASAFRPGQAGLCQRCRSPGPRSAVGKWNVKGKQAAGAPDFVGRTELAKIGRQDFAVPSPRRYVSPIGVLSP